MNTESKSKPPHLPFFAYGTLLPGQPNYYLWREGIQSRQTAMLADCRLYNMGYYPMLVEEVGGTVHGMLVTVWPESYEKIMERLDKLEGYDPDAPEASAYRRLQREIQLEDGRSTIAWTYMGQPKYVTEAIPVEGGDWVNYIMSEVGRVEAWWSDIDSILGMHESDKDR